MYKNNEFGKKIKELRLKKGWNKSQLSRRSGVSQPSISRIEKGEQKRVGTFIKNALYDALLDQNETIVTGETFEEQIKNFDGSEKNILRAIKSLPTEDQADILHYILSKMVNAKQNED